MFSHFSPRILSPRDLVFPCLMTLVLGSGSIFAEEHGKSSRPAAPAGRAKEVPAHGDREAEGEAAVAAPPLRLLGSPLGRFQAGFPLKPKMTTSADPASPAKVSHCFCFTDGTDTYLVSQVPLPGLGTFSAKTRRDILQASVSGVVGKNRVLSSREGTLGSGGFPMARATYTVDEETGPAMQGGVMAVLDPTAGLTYLMLVTSSQKGSEGAAVCRGFLDSFRIIGTPASGTEASPAPQATPPYASKEGGFRAGFPGKPEVGRSGDSGKTEMVCHQLRSGSAVYTVFHREFPDLRGKEVPDTVREESLRSLVGGNRVLSRRAGPMGGGKYPMIRAEFDGTSESGEAIQGGAMVVWNPRTARVYMILATVPKNGATGSAACRDFLDSFQIDEAPAAPVRAGGPNRAQEAPSAPSTASAPSTPLAPPAGVAPADGWFFRSAAGRFQARFPGKPTLEGGDGSGAPSGFIKPVQFKWEDPAGGFSLVLCFFDVNRSAVGDGHALLRRLGADFARGGRVLSETCSSFGPRRLPMVEVMVAHQDLHKRFVLIRDGERVYMVLAVSETPGELTGRRFGEFMASLEVGTPRSN